MKRSRILTTACILTASLVPAFAQEQAGDKPTVTLPKEQYQKLLDEHQKLLEEMKEMKAFRTKMEESLKKTAQQAETDQALDDLDKKIKETKQMAKDSYPGSTKLLLTGYGSAGFEAQNRGGDNKFYATFNPIFLWKLNDRVFFEGELEAELEGHDTSLALEMAQLSYIATDYLTLGGGKFLNPMNYFVERQHMAWVNKLPDRPLAVYDGLLPEANVGFQARGGVPLGFGSSKIGYSLYVANAPELKWDAASVDASELGTFEWDNFDNVGKHVALGGRLGVIPIPELEFGYGFQYSEVSAPGPGTPHALFHSVDASYIRESTVLAGLVNLKAQWVWTQVGNVAYDPTAVPTRFKNNRDGGYVQLAYRPTRVENNYIKNLEPVVRYDMLSQENTPTGVDERRFAVGLNYWLAPSTVFKVAYEFDHQTGPNRDPHDAVMVQFVTGF